MLTRIVDVKRMEVARQKHQVPLTEVMATMQMGTFAFAKALAARQWSLIAECKLASPVKGALSGFTVSELAGIYEMNGAAALSVLTDSHFYGSLAHVREVRAVSRLPILRKDFIIDEYQIYQARAAGADAILLIAAILDDNQIIRFLAIAKELGLDCLVEVHSREELERVFRSEAPIIGINNRDLQTFQTDIQQTFALLPYCGTHRLIISESGINTRENVCSLKQAGVRGALVGEGLVTAADISRKVRELSLTEREEF